MYNIHFSNGLLCCSLMYPILYVSALRTSSMDCYFATIQGQVTHGHTWGHFSCVLVRAIWKIIPKMQQYFASSILANAI